MNENIVYLWEYLKCKDCKKEFACNDMIKECPFCYSQDIEKVIEKESDGKDEKKDEI